MNSMISASTASFFRLPPAIRTAVLQRAVKSPIGAIGVHPALVHHTTTYPAILRPQPCSPLRSYSTATSDRVSIPQDTPDQPRRRTLLNTTLFLVFFAASFAMAAAPAVDSINSFTKPPTDSETLQLFHPPTPTSAEIDAYITNHPLARRLRAQPNQTESRAHMKIPEANRPHNLTGGVLMGEGKLEVPPLAFNDTTAARPTMTQIFYLGPDLCGHPGIVHGGMLATMLDEGLARTCFPALPNKVGVTATLKIDYRRPCEAGRYVVFKGETTKVEGRKVWVKGWIEMLGEEDGDGVVVVEAEALFVEPKLAKYLPKSYVESA